MSTTSTGRPPTTFRVRWDSRRLVELADPPLNVRVGHAARADDRELGVRSGSIRRDAHRARIGRCLPTFGDGPGDGGRLVCGLQSAGAVRRDGSGERRMVRRQLVERASRAVPDWRGGHFIRPRVRVGRPRRCGGLPRAVARSKQSHAARAEQRDRPENRRDGYLHRAGIMRQPRSLVASLGPNQRSDIAGARCARYSSGVGIPPSAGLAREQDVERSKEWVASSRRTFCVAKRSDGCEPASTSSPPRLRSCRELSAGQSRRCEEQCRRGTAGPTTPAVAAASFRACASGRAARVTARTWQMRLG